MTVAGSSDSRVAFGDQWIYPYQRLSRWHRLWRRIWCPLDGHGGIATTHPGGYFAPDGHCFCKRCGARVKLI